MGMPYTWTKKSTGLGYIFANRLDAAKCSGSLCSEGDCAGAYLHSGNNCLDLARAIGFLRQPHRFFDNVLNAIIRHANNLLAAFLKETCYEATLIVLTYTAYVRVG